MAGQHRPCWCLFERIDAARFHIGLICPNLSTMSVRLVVHRSYHSLGVPLSIRCQQPYVLFRSRLRRLQGVNDDPSDSSATEQAVSKCLGMHC